MSITTPSALRLHCDGSTCSAIQIQASTCRQVDDSDCAEISASQVQLPELPEDILHRIHALMEMQDAAKAACVCRSFLRSWRCYPNLDLSIYSLGIKQDASTKREMAMEFVSRVDHILQNHSGMGVKTFSLETYPCSDLHPSHVDLWLQVAFTSRIEKFQLSMFEGEDMKYNFPCSVFSSVQRSSIRFFSLAECSFHSAAQVGCMSSLTNLHLSSVHVTGEELYGFLSNSCALKKISLTNCMDIICLRIPSLLKELTILDVFSCLDLKFIESNAPNLSIFSYLGDQIRISLGDAHQVRKVRFYNYDAPGALYYARTKLPFIAPNVLTLVLLTRDETVNTPMTYGRFVHLKHLEIVACAQRFTPDYDFCSLISFLDASPALETFILRIDLPTLRPDSIVEDPVGDSSRPRRLSECCHDHLKNVMITGFCSAKSMIELTIHIIEKTKSLACLTLDTTRGHDRRFNKVDRCLKLSEDALVEAEKARAAIQRYVEGRVPSSVDLKVKFKIDGDFMPLPEDSLRSAMNENYLNGRFNPKLTATQVEKLRALFQPVTLLLESAPPHDVDSRPPPPHDVDNWPPAPPVLPPSAIPAQPPAYPHHPTPYIAPPDAHSMLPEAYPPPCPYLPLSAPGMVTATGYGYGDGYEAYGPFSSAYQYMKAPPSCSLFAQYPMLVHVSDPAYCTGLYYAPYQSHPYPYQHCKVDHHYQQSTYERATYYGSGWGVPR